MDYASLRIMSANSTTPYPYSERTADFMDMAKQDRPEQLLLPLTPSYNPPSPGDVGTLQGLQHGMHQVVARIRHPILRLRLALLMEEVYELADACLHENMELIARNVADVLYVTHSFPHSLGYDGAAVYECVHQANMQKRMGKTRSDGKQLAPVNFSPPNVREVLEAPQRAAK
jgi:hypothetical protein